MDFEETQSGTCFAPKCVDENINAEVKDEILFFVDSMAFSTFEVHVAIHKTSVLIYKLIRTFRIYGPWLCFLTFFPAIYGETNHHLWLSLVVRAL